MTNSNWWNDQEQLARVFQRFQSEGLGRRAFLKYVAAVGGTAALSAALVACGEDEEAEDTEAGAEATEAETAAEPGAATEEVAAEATEAEATEEPAAQATEAEPAGEAAAPSGEIVIAQGADPETLDPHATTTRSTWNVASAMYEALTKVTFTEAGEFSLDPWLATSWELQTGSDVAWTVKLQEGVTFHNGEPFNAEAAKFSIERMLNGGDELLAKSYVAGIASVEVVDPTTLTITTDGPYPLLPLDMSNIYMVPPEYTASIPQDQFAQNPVGTGPFQFVEWVKDDHVTVEAYTDYWGTGPRLQTVRFIPIPEGSTRTAALATGEADVVTLISIPDVASLQQASGVNVHTALGQRCVYMLLNNTGDHPLQDQRVRQALNYAVNKEAIIENVMQGYATILKGQTITPQYFGFNPNLEPYPYDPDRARSLLAEAGFADGFEVTLYSPRGRYIFDFETAQAVAGQLAEVGVTATVEALEWAVYIERLANHELTPMVYTAWATYNDGSRMMVVFTCEGLYSHTCLPEFDELFPQARTTLDNEERNKAIQQLVQIQHDQALALFLFQLQNIYGVRDRVQNFELLPNESFFLQDVSVSG